MDKKINGTRDTILNEDGYLNLTYTKLDWNVPQTVEIVGLNDFYDDNDVSYEILALTLTPDDLGYTSMSEVSIRLVNRDDDTAELVAWEISENTGYVSEPTFKPPIGYTGEILYYLTTEPKSAVLVAASSTDDREARVATGEGSKFQRL